MDEYYVWLKLCKRASRMSSDRFAVWAFMVGIDGSLAERIERGKRALAELGITWDLQLFRGNVREEEDVNA